ncbi:MAG: B12-binding domain-containing radical SAM protein [Candidatus Omnitrophica bacterium]|nr:B12-binding domain-containing radical SAM protein [Candidatus Omnitrophota bacterium]
MKTDILFINPGNQKKTYQVLSNNMTAVDVPVWVLLLADYLREKGYSPAIYDANVDGWNSDSAKRIISVYNPELIVLMVYGHQPSASTQTMPAAGTIAESIKVYNKDIPIAIGGTHPSSLPERTLNEENVDFIIDGEGIYTIEGLIDALRSKRKFEDVKGLWYRNKNSAAFTSPATIVNDLDKELGGYAWDLLPALHNYRAHNWHCFQDFNNSRKDNFSDIRSPYVSLYSSLGCPYSCSYCCINAIFKKPGIRYWSVEKVISWMDILFNKYGVRNIRLADELFILSPRRVEKFCDMLIERDYGFNLWVYGRVDTIKAELLKKLKKAGVNWIALGIESADEKVRQGVNKIINKDIREIIGIIKSYDINIMGNYMFGLPGDNKKTMEETLRLAMELNCEFANFYTVMAYPGSLLYRDISKKEDCLPKTWQGFSQHSYETRPLATNYLSAKEVLEFRDQAYSRYFTNPEYLDYIGDKFGEKVTKHIIEVTEMKLRRKLLEVESV